MRQLTARVSCVLFVMITFIQLALACQKMCTTSSVVKDTGWVCADCRNSGRSNITVLQSSLSHTNEELSIVKSLLKDLKGEIDKVKSDITTATPNHSDSARAPNVVTQAMKESAITVQNVTPDELKITTVIRDINCRKNNVVISGIPKATVSEETDKRIADRNTFIGICEEHLDAKPSLYLSW